MAFLLRRGQRPGGLVLDGDGWADIKLVCDAAARLMSRSIEAHHVEGIVESLGVHRYEIQGAAVRATRPWSERARVLIPDILYHATTAQNVQQYRAEGVIRPHRGRVVFFSEHEGQAWRIAHRLRGEPRVLYVDTNRTRRQGVRFSRGRQPGLFYTNAVATRDVLNLQDDFDFQLSAGGLPVVRFPDGRLRVALIQVARRHRLTWEIAKGKLEPGETPEAAAIREVQEEMGISVPLNVVRFVDRVRYGFVVPGGSPRLKSMFLYLMTTPAPIEHFKPAQGEGIRDVGWFTGEEAQLAVSHTSLHPVMRKVKTHMDHLERNQERSVDRQSAGG